MRPQASKSTNQDDLFRSRLEQIINLRHCLVKLANTIDWVSLDEANAQFYGKEGRPGVRSRLMIGLHLLKHMYDLSDEAVCDRWLHDPYFQYFCGEEYFQHELPMERSSMSYWRERVGEAFCVRLLQESLSCAHTLGAIETKHVEKVVVDTTVQPKAVTFPTDAKLCYKALKELRRKALEHGMMLRQSYERVSKKALVKYGHYRHAKQMKRAKRQLKTLKNYLGRVIRDIERQLVMQPELKPMFQVTLMKAQQIFDQTFQSSHSLFSWHAPEVECIAKGKADKPYEFGCKVSITTTLHAAPAGHFVLHAMACHGRPYDGHTLAQAIEGTALITGRKPHRIFVDKGYRGHNYEQPRQVFKSGQKRGITAAIKQELKRRNVVEPLIGHLKNDGRLGRNYLKGQLGDRMNAVLVAAGYNFRLILRWLKLFWLLFLSFFISDFICSSV